jgi:hypothetical protein
MMKLILFLAHHLQRLLRATTLPTGTQLTAGEIMLDYTVLLVGYLPGQT